MKFHKSQIVKDVCERKRVIIKYLPAYSPQLNSIEEYFSIVKSRYTSLNGAKNTFNQIRDSIEIAMFTVEYGIYQNLYANMRNWVRRALAGELVF